MNLVLVSITISTPTPTKYNIQCHRYMHLGVAKCLVEQGLLGIEDGVQYAGCSAGALTCVGILLGGDFDLAIQLCKG